MRTGKAAIMAATIMLSACAPDIEAGNAPADDNANGASEAAPEDVRRSNDENPEAMHAPVEFD